MKKTSTNAMMFTEGYSAVMIQCRCGDTFQAQGKMASIRRKQIAWEKKHNDCTEKKREGSKVFWLSFCNGDRPTGTQFLGACLVEVSAAEADDAMIDVLLRFPFAQPNAEWIAAAVTKAHTLRCNPGGEVASLEIDPAHPKLKKYQFGVLMDRATIERIDQEFHVH